MDKVHILNNVNNIALGIRFQASYSHLANYGEIVDTIQSNKLFKPENYTKFSNTQNDKTLYEVDRKNEVRNYFKMTPNNVVVNCKFKQSDNTNQKISRVKKIYKDIEKNIIKPNNIKNFNRVGVVYTFNYGMDKFKNKILKPEFSDSESVVIYKKAPVIDKKIDAKYILKIEKDYLMIDYQETFAKMVLSDGIGSIDAYIERSKTAVVEIVSKMIGDTSE